MVKSEKKAKLVMESIKANIFSTVFLIILGALLILAYLLLKDYVTSLCFAFISAVAIKPLKEYVLRELVLNKGTGKQNNLIEHSTLVRIFSFIYQLFRNPRENLSQVVDLISSLWNSVKYCRADIYSLLRLALLYFGIFKVKYMILVVSFGVYLLIDIILRSIVSAYRAIFKRKTTGVTSGSTNSDVKSLSELQAEKKEKQEEEQLYNRVISVAFVLGFVGTVVFMLVAFGGLCLWDLINMKNKITVQLQEQLNTANSYLEQEGIKSYLDEKYIKEQLLGQVDKLDTYISSSNLLPAIQVFQGVVNSYFNTNSSLSQEKEETYQFRLKIDACQLDLSKYSNNSYIPQFVQNSANELTFGFCYVKTFINSMEINFSEILNDGKKVGGELYTKLQQGAVWIVSSFFTFVLSLIDYFLQTVIYLTSLYYLLTTPRFNLSQILVLLPVEHEIKDKLQNSLEKNIQGVFSSTIKVAFYHILLTWLLLDMLDMPFSFISSILAGVIAVLPIVPVYCITLPYIVYLYFTGKIIEMVLLGLLYYHVSTYSIEAIYSRNLAIHPYITGICVAMGMSVFDLKGIIIGPLIVCSIYLFIDVLMEMQKQKSKVNSELEIQGDTPEGSKDVKDIKEKKEPQNSNTSMLDQESNDENEEIGDHSEDKIVKNNTTVDKDIKKTKKTNKDQTTIVTQVINNTKKNSKNNSTSKNEVKQTLTSDIQKKEEQSVKLQKAPQSEEINLQGFTTVTTRSKASKKND